MTSSETSQEERKNAVFSIYINKVPRIVKFIESRRADARTKGNRKLLFDRVDFSLEVKLWRWVVDGCKNMNTLNVPMVCLKGN